MRKEDIKKRFFFPLILKRCQKCSLVQLSQFVDPKNFMLIKTILIFHQMLKHKKNIFQNMPKN